MRHVSGKVLKSIRMGMHTHTPTHTTSSYPSRVRDMCRDLVVLYNVEAPQECVGTGVAPLFTFSLFVLLQVPGGKLLSTSWAAGRAAWALRPLVALHPVTAVAVSAAVVTAFDPENPRVNTSRGQSTRALVKKIP